MTQEKERKEGELAILKKGEAVGFVVYAMAKLGYSRLQIEELVRELRSSFNMKCRSFIFDANLTAGRIDRKKLIPKINSQDNHECKK